MNRYKAKIYLPMTDCIYRASLATNKDLSIEDLEYSAVNGLAEQLNVKLGLSKQDVIQYAEVVELVNVTSFAVSDDVPLTRSSNA